ncbi:MAG TPA: DUF6544 family protein [bacterium]|nr:DUF6544 family protein [bacterium]
MKILLIGLEILVGLIVVLVVVTVIGKKTFTGKVHREVTGMFDGAMPVNPDTVTESEVVGLPEPVQRWLRFSGIIGDERILTVRLKQRGEFRMSPDGSWMPFTAEQYYTTERPAFIWYTTMKSAPFLPITGRDRYWQGRGNMLIKLLSIVPVVDATGPEMDQGTLVRFLNEMMWFPSAALNDYMRWEAIDDTSARATMEYQGVSGSAVFSFDQNGEMTNMVADRYRSVDDRFELAQWATPIEESREFGGIRIPCKGEGVWNPDSGDFSYIRVEITDIEYNEPRLY